MMYKPLPALTFLALSLGLATRAAAIPEGHAAATRLWTTQENKIKKDLWIYVPSASTRNGAAVTLLEVPPSSDAKGYIVLHITVDIQGQAPLRPGEQEVFSFYAQYLNPGTPNGSTYVKLRLAGSPAVYNYKDVDGTIAFERQIPAWGTEGSYDVSYTLSPLVRRRIVPPNTVAEVLIRKPSDEESVKLVWTDKGNVVQAATDYSFEVWEMVPFWWDKLIARGDFSETTQGTGEVFLTRDNRYLVDRSRFFRDKKDYNLIIRMRRKHDDYQNAWSEPVSVRFLYRGPGGFVERIKTSFGQLLDHGSRVLDRMENFFRLQERQD